MFVQLERPALEKSTQELRENITLARISFIEDVINAHKENYLDVAFLKEQLEHYESAAQDAVEGNLQLSNADSNDTLVEKFPSKAEKWTLIQAMFFASTVCTTIGEIEKCFE